MCVYLGECVWICVYVLHCVCVSGCVRVCVFGCVGVGAYKRVGILYKRLCVCLGVCGGVKSVRSD